MSIRLTNAAGTAKSLGAAIRVLNSDSPVVVLGSYAMNERSGNPGTVDHFGPSFSLNVRGIPSPSREQWTAIVAQVRKRADLVGKRVVVSVAAFDPEEYAALTLAAVVAGAHAVELNFGCPNMQEGGAFAPVMSYRPRMVERALDALTYLSVRCEMWAKVSPIFDDGLFADLASVLRHQRVDGVVAVNTIPQCLALTDAGDPVLSFGSGVGGMAGPAIKPIALAQAARWVREGFRTIGVGGIASGRDLNDFRNVGVESCQANTVIQMEGEAALDRIGREAR